MISSQIKIHPKSLKSLITLNDDDSLLGSIFAHDSKNVKLFLETNFQHQPVVIRGDVCRMDMIRDDFMHHLDLQTILESTSSDSIHVWLKSPNCKDKNSSLDSITVENASAALKLHNAGHSVYCRAPPMLEQFMVPKLIRELGMGIVGSDCDRFRRGEVETFISKQGHVTEWHTDFQENITFQLSGTKKWYFHSSSAVAPLRGCTPHFGSKQDAQVVEMQLKALRLSNPNFQADEFLQGRAQSEVEKESCVIINPGDVLYHPAGVWHRVECLQDSVAINVSLVGSSYAEIAASALQQLLWQDKRWRGPVILRDEDGALRSAQALLEAAEVAIRSLYASDILPKPCFQGATSPTKSKADVGEEANDHREDGVDDSDEIDDNEDEDDDDNAPFIDVASMEQEAVPRFFAMAKKFRFNPIAVICSEADLATAGWVRPKLSAPVDSSLFVVHCNFGNESLESACRSIVCVPNQGLPIVAVLLQWKRDALSVFTLCNLADQVSADGAGSKKRKRGTDQEHNLMLVILYGFFQSGLLTAIA